MGEREYMRRMLAGGAVADGLGHVIQGEKLVAGGIEVSVVVLPRGKQEQSSLSTRVEIFASGLGVLREPVLTQDDGRETAFKGGIHNLLFTVTDARRDEHGSIFTLLQVLVDAVSYFVVGDTA